MKKKQGYTLIELIIMTVIIGTIAIIIIGCIGVRPGGTLGFHFRTDPNESVRVLQLNNYKNVETTGYQMFGCGSDDYYHTGFSATAPNGQPVTGVVCEGFGWWGKSSTIHLK